MLFIFKKKTVVLDCVTSNPAINELYPIVKSSEVLPKWWKQLPDKFVCNRNPEFDNLDMYNATMKTCTGFVDLHKNSISIPLSCDVNVQTKDNGVFGYMFADNTGAEKCLAIDSHNRQEFGSEFDHLIHLKIVSPWLLFEKTGINFHATMPFWHHIKRLNQLFIPPGVVNYKFQHSSHINIFVPKVNDLIKFSAGIPLLNLMPLTEKKVKVKTHVVDDLEYTQLLKKVMLRSKFFGSYNIQKSISKSKKTCPFNFK